MRLDDNDGSPVVDTRAGYSGPVWGRADYDTQGFPAVKTGSIILGAVSHILRVFATLVLLMVLAAFGAKDGGRRLARLYAKEPWLEPTVMAILAAVGVAVVVTVVAIQR